MDPLKDPKVISAIREGFNAGALWLAEQASRVGLFSDPKFTSPWTDTVAIQGVSAKAEAERRYPYGASPRTLTILGALGQTFTVAYDTRTGWYRITDSRQPTHTYSCSTLGNVVDQLTKLHEGRLVTTSLYGELRTLSAGRGDD